MIFVPFGQVVIWGLQESHSQVLVAGRVVSCNMQVVLWYFN